jgi:hypothetical protein
MFWILMIMALIMTCSCLKNFKWYNRIIEPGCVAVWKSLATILCKMNPCGKKKTTMKRAYSSIWEIYDPKQKNIAAEPIGEQMELLNPAQKKNLNQNCVPVPDISSLSRIKPTGEPWKTIQALYGNWQLRAVLHDSHQKSYPIYYNPRSKTVTTQEGKILENVIKPSREDIDYFYQIVKNSKVPPSVLDDGVIRHKVHPNLYYNTGLKVWMNEDTKSSIPGLNAPQNFSLYIPPLEEEPDSIEAV